jgi:MoaA/NifB/PqqE/SkfB family radical SAM enzyme
MQLGLLVTFRCNAECEHCLVDAGPHRSEVMEETDVRSYIDQACVIPYGTSALCLSGGEVFLYPALLERIISYAATKFASISVVTNAFWAKNEAIARRKLEPLQAAGLDTLVVSASPFHSVYVNPARAGFAVAAADRLGMRTHVKCTGPSDGPTPDQRIRALGPGANAASVQHMSLLAGGRARGLPPSAFTEHAGIPQGRCPGAVLTISPNGDAYFCCTPGAFIDALKLGNAKTSSIQDLVQEYYMRGIFAFLRCHGPAALVPDLKEAGLGGKLRAGYVDVCHLCTSLLSDLEIAKAADEVAARFQSTFLHDLFLCAPDEIEKRYGPSLDTPSADEHIVHPRPQAAG